MERKLWSAVSIPMYSFIDVAQNPQNSRASWSLLSSQVCWWQETTKRFIRMDNSGEIRWDSKKLLHTSWQEFWWRRGTWKFQRQQKASGFWDCFFLVEGPSKRWEVHEHGQRKCRFVVDDLWKIHNGFPFHPSQNASILLPSIQNLTSHLEVAEPGIYKLLHQEHDARQENGSSHEAADSHHRGDHGVHGTIRHVHFRPQEEVQSPMNRDP